MKPIKMTSEELELLKQADAYKKLMNISSGETKEFAQRQYQAWCMEFFNLE